MRKPKKIKSSIKYKMGDFIHAYIKKTPDGVYIITIVDKDGRKGVFKARRLNQPDEEILEDQEI